jgi:hypothetical protein
MRSKPGNARECVPRLIRGADPSPGEAGRNGRVTHKVVDVTPNTPWATRVPTSLCLVSVVFPPRAPMTLLDDERTSSRGHEPVQTPRRT